jgi:transposase-like protein
MKRRRDCPIELKRFAVSRVAAGEGVCLVARALKVSERRLYDWWAKYREGGLEALRGRGRPDKAAVQAARVRPREAGEHEVEALQRRNAELERKIGQQQVDLDFFRQALQLVQDRQQASAGRGGRRSTKSSKG